MIDQLIKRMIDEGKITQEEVDKMIEEEREKSPLLFLSKEQAKIKQETNYLNEQDLNNKEALLELYMMLGGI